MTWVLSFVFIAAGEHLPDRRGYRGRLTVAA